MEEILRLKSVKIKVDEWKDLMGWPAGRFSGMVNQWALRNVGV